MVAERLPASRLHLRATTDFAFANPQACALLLDVDGTLLDLAATPKSVRIPEGLVDLLRTLSDGLGGALGIISGRLISDIDLLLSPLRLTASGVHGAELRLRPDGDVERMSPALPHHIVTTLRSLAAEMPGVIVEPKGPGLAIHYRLAPDAEAGILAQLEAFLDSHPGKFTLWPGKKIFEIIPSGLSKGTALAALVSQPAFHGRVPIMIGDDIGDEPAFAAAEGLAGFGLRVAGEHYDDDLADFSGPRTVVSWLETFAQQLAQPLKQASNSA